MGSRNKLTVRVTARIEVPSSDGLECCIDALLASLVSMLDEPRGEYLSIGFTNEGRDGEQVQGFEGGDDPDHPPV